MTIINYIIGFIGLLGILFGLSCYRELRRWANLCNHSKIVIAYKKRVKTQQPLTEYIKWIQALNEEESHRGRVIYILGGTTVAIMKTITPPNRFQKWLSRHKQPETKLGRWSRRHGESIPEVSTPQEANSSVGH